MSRATVYLIRHGEKPEPEENGLSPQGIRRSQALPGVFGPGSSYNIGYIMAQRPGTGEPLLSFLSYLFRVPFLSPTLPLKEYQAHSTASDHLIHRWISGKTTRHCYTVSQGSRTAYRY